MKTATLRDVAARCGVSTAVVSAALSNARGSVRFSARTGERVRRAAAEMSYSPNRLAQAIRKGTVPVVAVSLHARLRDSTEINTYLHDILPAAGMQLHELGMEMLFVPYTDHGGQIRRLRSLLSDRLIGGVVSNFVGPGQEGPLLSFLRAAGLPFVVLGRVSDPAVPSVAADRRAIRRAETRYAAARGLRRILSIDGWTPEGDALLADDGRHPGAPFHLDAEAIRNRRDTLFAAPGARLFRQALESKLIPADRLILVEDARLWPGTRPAILVRSCVARIAEMAADVVARWMQSGQPPRKGRITVALTEDDVVLETGEEGSA